MSDPVTLNVKRSGLGLDVSVQKRKMTGLSVDYQGSTKAADVAPVLQVIEGAMSGPSPRGVLPFLVEGIASLDRDDKRLSKHPTVMNVRSTSIKMGLTLKRNRVTGLSIDYQRISNGNDIKELLGVLNRICSTEALPAKGEMGPGHVVVSLASKGAVVLGDKQRVAVIQAAQESLKMLGEQGTQIVLALLEKRYGLGLEEVPRHHRAFIDLLRQVVGDGAAEAVEKEMVNEIKKKFRASGETLREVIDSLGAGAEEGASTPTEVESAPVQVEAAEPAEEKPLEIPTVSLSFRLSGGQSGEPEKSE